MMYGMAFKMNDVTHHISGFITWQTEIRELYRNYLLVDSILNQSTKLPNETRSSFKLLHHKSTTALERFIRELDDPATHPHAIKQVVFSKHVIIMKQLNKSIDDLISQHSLCQYQQLDCPLS
jgi:hypothetical protein